MLIELGIVASQPFQHHGRMLLLLVAIVLEDGAQFGIVGRPDTLVVPVDGLQLLHQRVPAPAMMDVRAATL